MAPINAKSVTVLGSHWPDGPLWAGFDFTRAELRSHSLLRGGDYHLGVPWAHPDDRKRSNDHPDVFGVYRLRLKRPWKSFVQVDGVWMVSKEPPQTGVFGTPQDGQIGFILEVEP
jgi:hypothetical protein